MASTSCSSAASSTASPASRPQSWLVSTTTASTPVSAMRRTNPACSATGPPKVPVATTGTRPAARATTREARASRSSSERWYISLDWQTAKRPFEPLSM